MDGYDDFEFWTYGRAVSAQSRNAKSAWQAKLRDAIAARIEQTVEHLYLIQDTVFVSIFIMSPARVDVDLDNLAKPILDTLVSSVIVDDRQIKRLWVERFEDGEPVPSSMLTDYLLEGVVGLAERADTDQLVYVQVATSQSWRQA